MRCTGLIAVRPAHSTSGRVEHDGQRAGDVGAGLHGAMTTGAGCGTGGQHLVDGGLLEAVQQVADRLVDPGDAGDGLRCRG